jgi:hypothetical protein
MPPTAVPDAPAPVAPGLVVTPTARHFLAALHPPVTIPDPSPPPTAAPVRDTPGEAEAGSALQRILRGPTGPGTTSLSLASWNNESSMYVDLDDLFAEHSRFLRVGGRYVTITGCWNPRYGQPSKWVSQINAHFECNIHSRREYLRAMADNRLVPQTIVDLTPDTLPYWELRATSSLVTGIEKAFIESYRDGSFQYVLIAADRV